MENKELTFDEEGHAVCPTCHTDIVNDSFSEQENAEYVMIISLARKDKPTQRVYRVFCQDKEELETALAVFQVGLKDAEKRLAEMHVRIPARLQGESET